MLRDVRAILTLLVAIAAVMVANGLLAVLLGVRASLEGFPVTVTGLIMSCYYIGFLAGAWLLPRAVRRIGHVRVFAALGGLCAAASLLHGLFPQPLPWMLFRALTGLAYAGFYLVAESWLNAVSNNQERGGLLSVYMTLQFVALAIGQMLLNVAPPAGLTLFVLAAALLTAAALVMRLGASAAPSYAVGRPINLVQLFRLSPLGLVTGFCCGLAQGSFYNMAAVWGVGSGLSAAAVSLLLSLAMIGGLVAQWPFGRLSDRVDRRLVILGVALAGAGLALAAGLAAGHLPILFYVLIFLFGGTNLPLYGLGIAHANDSLSPEQVIAASGTLLFTYGTGAILGPSLAAVAMSAWGAPSFFALIAAAQAAIALFALRRIYVVGISHPRRGCMR